MLFERDGEEFEFGRNLRGRNRVIADLTRPNSLFVAAATQNGHEELSKISGFFRTISNDELPSRWSISDSRATDFLGLIGTGIVGARVSKVDVSEKAKEFASEFASLIKRTFGEGPEMQFDNRHPEKLELAHKGKDGAEVYFDLDDESAGTRRLVGFLVAAYLALDRGSVMIVDELDESLHTAACEALLALFMSPTANPRGAQLVATTHDTNLLRCPSLRRDQVWFTEKDGEGATHLYPLTDFRTRRGDNLERGYLQGRYGATPFSGSLADIIALN